MSSSAPERPLIAVFAGLLVALPTASAQPDATQYAEEPTGGLHLPTAGIAGEQDASALVTNPAGLQFLTGPHLGIALDLASESEASGSGAGGGGYLATGFGGGFLPRIGFGFGLEFLRPPRVRLDPDPGSPTRLTMAASTALGASSALGFSWHHFYDSGGALGGVDTYDVGLASRLGAHMALGFVVRDVASPVVANTPVQRRYELELVTRPTGTDRLELGLGARVGETRVDFADGTDVDGWLRAAVRVARGTYVRAELITQSLHELVTSGSGTDTRARRELVASAGLSISFGSVGTAAYGTGALDPDRDARARGGTFTLSLSPVQVPSVLPRPQRIERLELKGVIDDRALTGVALRLRSIARDPDVVALVLKLDGFGGGWATMREIRTGLERVSAAGKKVFVYLVSGSTREYYVASAADKIYVDPAGSLFLDGFAGTTIYFKGLFDKLGVSAEFEKIDEYKSAPEQWTLAGPSEPALRMRNELYDNIYAQLLADIGKGRSLSADRVGALVDHGPYTAGDLDRQPWLVDDVALPEAIDKKITEELGGRYLVGSAPRERDDRWAYPKLAVIYIEGDIVGGESRTLPIIGTKLVGGDTIARTIAVARADPDIEAIVLRINSPGGSALASEVMAREVFKTRGVKPIICSMGDVAASGGYFAAAGCDWIFADPMTITGSIGIFNGKFDVSGMMLRLGLTWTTLKRGEHSDSNSPFRPFTEQERALMKTKLSYYYGNFLKTVAEGRKMTTTEVDAVGRGRVWSGARALDEKLIDEFGGIEDAIVYAKAAVGLTDDDLVQVVALPRVSTSLLSRLLGGGAAASAQSTPPPLLALPGTIGADLIQALPGSIWAEPGVPQARLPFSVVWSR